MALLLARLQQAVALHQQGQLAQAQALYEDVLKLQPNHFDALHLLGIVAYQTNNPLTAVELIDRAIEISPENPAAYSNRGLALQALMQLDAALASYDRAIALKPDFAEAYYNRAVVLQAQGHLDAALASYDLAIANNQTTAEAYYNRGAVLQALQQLDAALASYDRALGIRSDFAEAYSNRGATFQELGQLDAALTNYNQALAIKPDYAAAYYNRGIVQQELGQLEAALTSYDQAIASGLNSAEICYNRGGVLQALGRLDSALVSYDHALALKPGYVEAYYNRGIVLQELGQLDASLASYDQALALKPDYAEAYYNRGIVLKGFGRLDSALVSYDHALALQPDYVEAYYNRGIVLQELGQLDASLASYDQALALQPDYAEAYSNRGIVLQALGRADAALVSYNQAVALKPDFAEAYYNRGNALQELKQWDIALASYDRALALKPDSAEAYYNRGVVLQELGQNNEVEACFQQAVRIKPGFVEARWAIAMSQIPTAYGENQDAEIIRANFLRELETLSQWFDSTRIDDGWKAVGTQQPFYLAYQEEANKALLAQYGSLCARLMGHWQQKHEYRPASLTAEGRIRIGIVSSHICDHSVWNALIKGWMLHLDPSRFDIAIFALGTKCDAQTELAKSIASVFIQGKKSLAEWVEVILESRIEVLLFPEIGMESMTTQLASMRLASLQMAVWGHPETTGLPTMDYFISAEDFETEASDQHYTETLIKLPHLGCCYHGLPVLPARFDLEKFGLDSNAPLLLCPGVPFKYAPQYDAVWAEIAHKLGKCQLVFFTYHEKNRQSGIFRERLQRAFNEKGLDFDDYGVFIPWLDRATFYGLMQQADVFLDTIGFSGFNTAMQAVECGLPIVTREGHFMRGRFASGILKRIGLPELVALTEADYVDIAVKLVRDSQYRHTVRRQMEESRHILFNDIVPVRAMEDFLTRIIRQDAI